MQIICRFFVPILLLSFVLPVAAGEIILKNGDRLTGTIVEQTDEIIVIETDYAGKVRIFRKHVANVVLDTAAEKPASAETVEDPKNAATTEAQVKSLTPEPAAKNTDGKTRSGFRRLASNWLGTANVGFNYTSGNSNFVTLATSLRASKVRANDGVMFYIRSLWNSNHGSQSLVTTQNAFWGGARYDRTIKKRVFGFASYDFERDKPKKLTFRSVVGGGLGHRTIKNDRTELEFIAGAGWNRTWRVDNDTNTPEVLSGLTFKHKLNPRLKYQNNFTYFQNITKREEFRFVFDSTISVDVTKRIGIFLSVGDRFNNNPFGNAKKNDFLFTTGLKWSFGEKK